MRRSRVRFPVLAEISFPLKDNQFVSPLVTQISWINHLLILSGTKTIDKKILEQKLREYKNLLLAKKEKEE